MGDSATKPNGLPLWCIYKHPSDYPGMFVVRFWNGLKPSAAPLIIADNLESARNAIPGKEYLVKIDRLPDDDPAILEVWI